MLRMITFVIGLSAIMFLTVPLLASAQGACAPTSSGQSTFLCNPLNRDILYGPGKLEGAQSLMALAIRLMIVFASFSALIPTVIVVAAGFQMLIAHGDAEAIQRAKTALSYAVYGFIMAFLSFVIIAGMMQFLGAFSDSAHTPNTEYPQNFVVNPLLDEDFGAFVIRMLVSFLQVAGLLAIVMLVLNGLRYITAGGDEEQIKQAKDALKWIMSGIITILFAYVIIRAAANLAGLP